MHFSSPTKNEPKPNTEQSECFDDPMMRRRRNPSTLSGGDSPSLNSRTKTTRKRPKYLSLRSQLSNPDTNDSPRLRPLRHYYTRRNSRRLLQQPLKQPQPPLHRPLLSLENSQALDDNVALLFTSSDDATATVTLTGLLVDREETLRTAAGTSEEDSVSLRCTYGGSGSPLIRSAMKSGYSSHHEGGEDHEEKWVHYSEVVEKKEEEVSSNYCTAVASGAGGMLCLSLKLDYQEVLDAWSDKGSLFIRHGIRMDESPQTVPDLCAEFDGLSSGISDWLANVANLWRVPEKGETGDMDCEDKEGRMRIREASVLRYKEKRHNRLFAKRIRYEVRKRNAEKRPRIKGRFVRRNGED